MLTVLLILVNFLPQRCQLATDICRQLAIGSLRDNNDDTGLMPVFQDDPRKPVQESSVLDFIAVRMTKVVVTTGAVRRAKLQLHHHRQQTNTDAFLSPNHVRALKGKSITALALPHKSSPSGSVLHPCLDHQRLLVIFGVYCQASHTRKLHVITF